jgi:DNA primase
MNKVFRFPSEAVGVTKGMFLYGFDMVEPGDYAIVTEAIFDSTTLGAQAVASGGAVLTDLQVRRIRALNPVNGVILAPDNDSAGMKSIASNYRMLRPYVKKIFYSVPSKLEYKKGHFIKDWNELFSHAKMGHAEIRKLFESNIKPLSQAEAVRFMING